jgi:hypothetical protein
MATWVGDSSRVRVLAWLTLLCFRFMCVMMPDGVEWHGRADRKKKVQNKP